MSNSTQLAPTGEALRDSGADVVLSREYSAWRADVFDAIDRLAATHLPFTAEDVRRYVPGEPQHHNSWGAAFNHARREGLIEPAGFTTAGRRTRHAAILRVWIGA